MLSPRSLYLILVSGQTGASDTFNDVSLTEEVENDQRSKNQNTAGIVNSRGIERLTSVSGIEGLRNLDDVGKQLVTGCCEEQVGVEVISPLPAEREHEYCYEHGDRKRNDNAYEGAEYAGTIKVCGFFEFVRDGGTEELAEHEDEQTVLICKTSEGHDEERPVRVDEVDGCCTVRQVDGVNETTAEEVNNTEDIEISELHEQRELKCGVRNNHREDNCEEDEVVALELELSKTISDKGAHESLDYTASERKKEGVEQSFEVAVVLNDSRVSFKSGVLGDESYGYVYEVFLSHERRGDLREEGEEDNVGDTEEEKESEEVPYYILYGVKVKYFSLNSFP